MELPKEIRADSRLTRAIRSHGPVSIHEWKRPTTPFHALIRSIIHQQVSGKAAESILKKFKSIFGNKFPTPEFVLQTPVEKLRAAGLSAQKAAYIRDLALKFTDGTIDPRKFRSMSNDEIVAHLVRVKGIGVWTAHMFLLFTLKRPDILPTLDLAIRKGFQVVYGLRTTPSHTQMERLAKSWRQHASLVSLYLWKLSVRAKKR